MRLYVVVVGPRYEATDSNEERKEGATPIASVAHGATMKIIHTNAHTIVCTRTNTDDDIGYLL